MDRFINDILKDIRENGLIAEGDRVTVGFSGGADSVCLLHVLCELKALLKIDVKAVHVNHGIRGEEAQRDEEFCKKEAEKLGIGITVKHVNVPEYASENGLSEEEAGRILRYEALREEEHDVIAIAHHADDQAETVLFNMLRGSALKGAGGMRMKRDDIVRPLLHKDKTEILEYLRRRSIGYVTDSTNLSNDHTRNYLRNEIIPALRQSVNRKAAEHIVKTADYIREADDYLSMEADGIADALLTVEYKGGRISADISRKQLKEKPQIIRRYVIIKIIEKLGIPLKDWTEKHISDIDAAITGPKGFHVDLPGNVKADNTADYTKISR